MNEALEPLESRPGSSRVQGCSEAGPRSKKSTLEPDPLIGNVAEARGPSGSYQSGHVTVNVP